MACARWRGTASFAASISGRLGGRTLTLPKCSPAPKSTSSQKTGGAPSRLRPSAPVCAKGNRQTSGAHHGPDMEDPLRPADNRQEKEKQNRHVALCQLEQPPNGFFACRNQTGPVDHCSMSRIERLRKRIWKRVAQMLGSKQEPFVRGNECGAENSFGGVEEAVESLQPKSEAKRKQNISENVAKCVQPRAALGIEIFGARDLAIAAVENTEELKERCAAYESEIIAAQQENEAGDR